MKQVKYLCSTNYQLNEFLLCAQPRDQLMFPCFHIFLTEFDVEINYWQYGVQNSAIFSLHSTRECNCTAARRFRVVGV